MGMICEMSEEYRKKSEYRRPSDYGLQNALAKWLRHKWGSGATRMAVMAFKLSEGRARGAHYATASLTTVNDIIKQGGWDLFLELGEDLLGTSLADHLIEKDARDEQRRQREARVVALLRGVSGGDAGDTDHGPRRDPERP